MEEKNILIKIQQPGFIKETLFLIPAAAFEIVFFFIISDNELVKATSSKIFQHSLTSGDNSQSKDHWIKGKI